MRAPVLRAACGLILLALAAPLALHAQRGGGSRCQRLDHGREAFGRGAR